jgi:hypothetical protein
MHLDFRVLWTTQTHFDQIVAFECKSKKIDAWSLIYAWLWTKFCHWLHKNLFGLWYMFAEFRFKCSLCPSCYWCLICFYKKKILCFFSLVLICFLFNCLFCFSFGSNHGFRFGLGLNQCFQVNSIGFVLG